MVNGNQPAYYMTGNSSIAADTVLRLRGSIDLRETDDAVVVYHRESATTLAINPIGADALQLATAEPLTPGEIVEIISARFPTDDAVVIERLVFESLSELLALGILESLPQHRADGGARV